MYIVSGSTYPLEASLKNGGSRDQPTTATLSLTPGKEDDGAVFRCEIWNRAMPEGTKLEATVTLGVNCKSSAYLLSPFSLDNVTVFMRPDARLSRRKSDGVWTNGLAAGSECIAACVVHVVVLFGFLGRRRKSSRNTFVTKSLLLGYKNLLSFVATSS